MYGLDEQSNYPLISNWCTPPWEEPEEQPEEYEPADDEMDVLRGKLNERGIDWHAMDEYGKARTLYPSRRGTVAVIRSNESYGGHVGLLEAWYPGDRHEGWLTANGVINSFPPIRRHPARGRDD